MYPRRIFLIIYVQVASVSSIQFPHLKPSILQSSTSPDVQRRSALSVMREIVPDWSNHFEVTIDTNLFVEEKDQFIISAVDGHLHINASSGVAATWGFNYYLKEYCNAHVGWQVQQLNMTNVTTLPFVSEIRIVANDRFRYYQNVCTASYSFVWWSTMDWRKHLRWMALNGINLVLAPHGQEAIWARIYKELGLTDDEIDEHFTGPAFLSWLRMGNIRGWAGPLSQNWHERSLKIQSYLVNEMENLGMIPILPAFAGYVPNAFERIFPNASYLPVQPWNNFDVYNCCPTFIDPADELFSKIGRQFLTEVIKEFGASHIYYSDPFNEMMPSSSDVDYLKKVSNAIYSTMKDVDEDAVWLLQNWMFVHDFGWWNMSGRAKAFLTAVPQGRMLILDLQSEQWPMYVVYNMYYGQAFIWCMLHNFGGTLGMFGNTLAINGEVYRARTLPSSTMIGTGLTPEGINQNYFIYELMLESAWRKTPIEDLDVWAEKYAIRRYGSALNNTKIGSAWRYLLRSVYNFRGLKRMRGKYVVTRRPSFNIKPWAWYNSHDLLQAWNAFIESAPLPGSVDFDNTGYYHDLCDLTRQILQYRSEQIYLEIVAAFKSKDSWLLKMYTSLFLDALGDMQTILATDVHFTIQPWLRSVNEAALTAAENTQYTMNALNQITLWGPNGEIVDYACKQWSEMFRDYYLPRWQYFLNAANECVAKGTNFIEKSVQRIISMLIEKEFPHKSMKFANVTQNTLDVARSMYLKWAVMPDLKDLPIEILLPVSVATSMPSESSEETELFYSSPSVELSSAIVN